MQQTLLCAEFFDRIVEPSSPGAGGARGTAQDVPRALVAVGCGGAGSSCSRGLDRVVGGLSGTRERYREVGR